MLKNGQNLKKWQKCCKNMVVILKKNAQTFEKKMLQKWTKFYKKAKSKQKKKKRKIRPASPNVL